MALLSGPDQPAVRPSQSITPLIPDASVEVQSAEPVQKTDAQPIDTVATSPKSKTELGQGFIDWLREGIASRKIIINDAKALVHTVSGTAMLVTPGIFKRFVQEFPALETQAKTQKLNAWELVQRSFEKLKLHRKTEASLNIWTVNVVGPRTTKKLRGYMLIDPLTLFNEVPFDNVSLCLPPSPSEGAE
ncbi:conjugal transfer nickase/helicase domain-containing protein [Pseudomonas sivasensis]|uniref:conjugal transfer nickase/helicase domain-containing protein n=1 Tax=Pseudomonas sivasensis TaxID=1880678 RepID=UPI001F5BC55D|nr:DNA-binding domain-containing protein [Pseudomonas sivasensis]